MMTEEAAVFDLALTIGGGIVPRFSDINVTRAAGGLGTSGVVITEMTFTIPACDIDSVSAYRAAPVEIGHAIRDSEGNITGVGSRIGLPTMYISGRAKSKGVITFTCRDGMAFLGAQIPYSDFTGNNGYIDLNSIIDYILHKSGLDFRSGGGYTNIHFPLSFLDGKSYADILQAVSAVLVGVWYETEDKDLQFIPFGNSAGFIRPVCCTNVEEGCEYKPSAILAADGEGNIYKRGSGFHSYDTLQIDSSLLTEDIVSAIDNRLNISAGNVPVFYGMRCERCKLDVIPPVICKGTFEETEDREWWINNIRASVTPTGIYASLVFNDPSCDEIGERGVLSKAIESRITYGEHGNWVFDKYKGLRIFVPSSSKSEE
ncbi:MAG: hypothetical protein NC120_05135 [Ruminococcus sp.]|nr:hypothetical protein [Ruminococcus sp.]